MPFFSYQEENALVPLPFQKRYEAYTRQPSLGLRLSKNVGVPFEFQCNRLVPFSVHLMA